VALLAALLALLVAGCNQVTGGGQFVSQGVGEVSAEIIEGILANINPDIYVDDTVGDKVSFGVTAQPTKGGEQDGEPTAKGQLTLVDQTQRINIHASLDFTVDTSDPSEVVYIGNGSASGNAMGGPFKFSGWSVIVHAYDTDGNGSPDYVEVLLFDSEAFPTFAAGWSGEVVHGNIVVH
jgi:hypothetical protein